MLDILTLCAAVVMVTCFVIVGKLTTIQGQLKRAIAELQRLTTE